MKLYDLAKVMRSKNAGPFTLSIDLMFADPEAFSRALGALTASGVAAAYGVDPLSVAIRPFERVLAIKVTFPRHVGSGGPGDRDVYGSQQHLPLGLIEV